ncbi:hypothetical protein COK81_24405 [Bacillus thuringiensis]|uniref:ADP ribosyltransferase domain-containing protein n=1 Tax=Bacillus thuringiensis TaxID=1428 RepID=A0A9X7AWE7_BACTU|nr:ADP-ribosyltransferase [Bacillus thuringiensis]PFT84868.1 hypothetical protein COK81_24405 [Bacillus thuringiensis]
MFKKLSKKIIIVSTLAFTCGTFIMPQVMTQAFAAPIEFRQDSGYAMQWAKQNYGNWRFSLGSEEVKAVDYYTQGGFMVLNEKLRTDANVSATSDIGKNISYISAALSKMPIPEDIVVYRGTGANALGALQDLLQTKKGREQLVGKVLVEKGFMSTSILRNKAFAKDIIFYLTVPQGTKGAYVGIGSVHDEREILLDKGYTYRINYIDVEPDTKKWRIYAEIVGQ